MKKIIAALLCACVALTFCSCSQTGGTDHSKLKIVTTVFPVYHWVTKILGENAENAEVEWLLDNGVDLHSYQPAADDIIAVSSCDLFVYIGGESDAWTEGVLREKQNEGRAELNLMEALGDAAKLEEEVEGMQAEEEEEEEAYDEHIWLSLKNAQTLCRAICASLSACDPEHAELYQKNTEAYCGELSSLDAEYAACVAGAARKTLLFADRFPFRYLCEDYGLAYFAAFSGCSAESEASFETVAFLAGKLNELGLPAVITLDGSAARIADTVIETAGAPDTVILTMDSLQSTTRKDAEAGKTYLDAMRENLETLKKALG